MLQNNWAAIHNPGALPIDGAEGEWLRDQWHKEKKKKALVAARVMPAAGVICGGVATKQVVEHPNKAVDRIRKENAAWLKGSEVAKEKAPILAAASLKDKETGKKKPGAGGCDVELLKKVHAALKDTKNSNYGLQHCALIGSNTPGHLGMDKDPVLKGLFAHMKKRPDPEALYLAKVLKIPPVGTPAATVANETTAIADIRKRNEEWLKSVGMEDAVVKGGKKPDKRDDVLAMAKKAYPEYEKPTALGVSGGAIKSAPTNSWGPTTPANPAAIKAQRVASAEALWPAPAPALKKTQDTELARIRKECAAYPKDSGESYVMDDFEHAHEQPHSAYYGGYHDAYGGGCVYAPVQHTAQPMSYQYY